MFREVLYLPRIQFILQTLIRYGFRMIVERLSPRRFYRRWRKREEEEKVSLDIPVKVRKICEELGTAFIKLGQLLSVRPDLVPLSFIKELEKLQDEVTPLPWEMIYPVIQKELGRNMELVSWIEEDPLASGSLAQVHRGKLRNGERIVFKIKKPGVEEIIRKDIAVMYTLSGWVEKFIPEFREYQPRRMVEEFDRGIRQELNFLLERDNLEIMGKVLQNEVRVPRIYGELCTPSLLVMEYVEGEKLRDIIERSEEEIREEICKKLTRSLFSQIFEYGIFHADPHPGNVLVREGDIYLLDLGIVGRLRPERRRGVMSLFYHLAQGDVRGIIRGFEILGILEEGEGRRIKPDLEDFLDRYFSLNPAHFRITEVAGELFHLFRKARIHPPYNLSLLFKALITWEGTYRLLLPQGDPKEELLGYLRDKGAWRVYLRDTFQEMGREWITWLDFLRELPRLGSRLEEIFKDGYLRVSFEHRGLKDLTSTLERSSRYLSLSILIGSLLVASSLVFLGGRGGKLLGLPPHGLIGAISGFFLLIWLLSRIIRRRRVEED